MRRTGGDEPTVESARLRTLGWALSYAARGLAVFPLVPGAKRPLTRNGLKDATTETALLTAWWTLNPDAGIGIRTGKISGVAVLDVDGPDGEASLAHFPVLPDSFGVFIMNRDGGYSWDCHDDERDRFVPIIEKIIEELREPRASFGRGFVPSDSLTYKPGDPRWFDRVLARLQNKGYEHVVLTT